MTQASDVIVTIRRMNMENYPDYLYPKVESVLFVDGNEISKSTNYIVTGDPCFPFDEAFEVSKAMICELESNSQLSIKIDPIIFKEKLLRVVINNTQENIHCLDLVK